MDGDRCCPITSASSRTFSQKVKLKERVSWHIWAVHWSRQDKRNSAQITDYSLVRKRFSRWKQLSVMLKSTQNFTSHFVVRLRKYLSLDDVRRCIMYSITNITNVKRFNVHFMLTLKDERCSRWFVDERFHLRILNFCSFTRLTYHFPWTFRPAAPALHKYYVYIGMHNTV